ncbi:hypothetical protein SCWH03_50780 [Streptomyces pacificus]|uniref:Uncharacterized protein n=1 Tax=Streptomyces pacificus TaxID=2705029 RepID=A0A6A0B4U5_9ACTN|nr:hypothetical protein SCWH03_50780 [Streptomyces pacificus]
MAARVSSLMDGGTWFRRVAPSAAWPDGCGALACVEAREAGTARDGVSRPRGLLVGYFVATT